MRQRSGEVVGRGRVVSFRFCFLFFYPQLMFAALLRAAARAHGEAGHERGGRDR